MPPHAFLAEEDWTSRHPQPYENCHYQEHRTQANKAYESYCSVKNILYNHNFPNE